MAVQFGIDVSNHQPNFDFASAKAEGYTFATHKVTEGSTYADPHWNRARDEMLRHFPGRCGGYVFCRTRVSPKDEADALERAFGDKSNMWLQIDYEDDQNAGSGADLAARVAEYQKRGFKLLPVYLPRWYWQGHMGSPDLGFLRDIGIWNSHYVGGTGYGSTLYNGVQDAWWAPVGGAPVKILQFSDKATVAQLPIDVNAIRSEQDLAAIFGGTPTTGGGTVADPKQIVIDGAAQLASPQSGDPERGVLGPRPQRRPERYNVAGNDPKVKQAWMRAMTMDLWNELVFDGYPVEAVAAEFDKSGASLVGMVAKTLVLTQRNNDILEALAKKEGLA